MRALLLLPFVLTLAPIAAHAVAWGNTAVTIDLGGGMHASRTPGRCVTGRVVVPGCAVWHLDGVAPPPVASMLSIAMFAASRGRVFAAVDAGVLFTDDRGEHWQAAAWDGPHQPRALAFDPRGDYGVAVGTNGTVWTTDDHGLSWRLRRDGSFSTFIDVAVLGDAMVFTDTAGGVWVSHDRATSLRTVADVARGPMPTLTVDAAAIWVRIEGARWVRVSRDGEVDAVDPS